LTQGWGEERFGAGSLLSAYARAPSYRHHEKAVKHRDRQLEPGAAGTVTRWLRGPRTSGGEVEGHIGNKVPATVVPRVALLAWSVSASSTPP
jgi:hypothetical protein